MNNFEMAYFESRFETGGQDLDPSIFRTGKQVRFLQTLQALRLLFLTGSLDLHA